MAAATKTKAAKATKSPKKAAKPSPPPLPPLARLRAGILDQDWSEVLAAYATLTGENLDADAAPPPEAEPPQHRPKKAAVPKGLTAEFQAAADLEAAVGLGGVVLPSLPAGPAQSSGPKNFGQQVDSPQRFVNKFVPPKPSPRELEIDRKLLNGVEPTERDREPDRTTDVQAVCGKCRRTYTAKSWEVNRRIAGDGGVETMMNRCPRC